jgi:glycolate oxidase subunit GlcD
MDEFVRQGLVSIVGEAGIRTDPGELLLYSYDAALDKALPSAVVLPESADQVSRLVRFARRVGVPYVARGAGTNLCGGSVPADGGWVLHLARMNRLLSVDPVRRRARVQPGVVNLHLQKALAPHGLFYAPDPASQKACTLGGNVGTNAGGPHCLKHGVTTNHVLGLEIVLPDGDIVRTSVDDAGYDLTGLFVGSEGTLGVVTEIELALLPLPEEVRTLLVSFPSMEAAARAVTDIVASGVVPTTLEVMDRVTVAAVEDFIHAGYPRDAEAVLLIELDGPRGRTGEETAAVKDLCRKNGAGEVREAADEAERQKLWEGRRGSYPAMARLAPNVLVEDGVVPRTKLPEAVRRIRAIADREGLRMGLIAHAGDGNLHPNMVFDERDPEQTRRVKAAGHEMLKVCVDLGGSVSGEHGIGTDKREAMRWLFSAASLAAFRRIKEAFDPDNLCNPDKLIPAPEGPAPDPASRLKDADPAAARDLPASGVVRVPSVERLRALLAAAERDERGVYLRGAGTRGSAAPAGSTVLDLTGLDRVVDHDRDNFTVTAQAGVRVDALRELLLRDGRHLHLPAGGTLGGLLAAGSGGVPPLRNQVLGLKAVLAGGALVEFGGHVMKNVAGYDLVKAFLGSRGTLGAVTEVTLRTHARPAEGGPSAPPKADLGWAALSLHRRVKDALDPHNRLNPAVFAPSATAAR